VIVQDAYLRLSSRSTSGCTLMRSLASGLLHGCSWPLL